MSNGLFKSSIRIDSNALEIASILRGQPYRRAENALRASMRAAAKVVQVEARRIVAVDTGALKKSIGVKVSAVKGGAFARVGVVDRREYEVKERTAKDGALVRRAAGRVKAGAKLGKKMRKMPIMYAPKIEQQQPFLKPALERKATAAIRVMTDRLRAEMAKPWPKKRNVRNARVWA